MSDSELKSLFSGTTLNLSPPPRLSLTPACSSVHLKQEKWTEIWRWVSDTRALADNRCSGVGGTWSLGHYTEIRPGLASASSSVWWATGPWTLCLQLGSAGGGRQVVAVRECKWSPTWWLTYRCVFIPCLMTLSTASRPTHAAVLQKWATDNNPQWCVKGEH